MKSVAKPLIIEGPPFMARSSFRVYSRGVIRAQGTDAAEHNDDDSIAVKWGDTITLHSTSAQTIRATWQEIISDRTGEHKEYRLCIEQQTWRKNQKSSDRIILKGEDEIQRLYDYISASSVVRNISGDGSHLLLPIGNKSRAEALSLGRSIASSFQPDDTFGLTVGLIEQWSRMANQNPHLLNHLVDLAEMQPEAFTQYAATLREAEYRRALAKYKHMLSANPPLPEADYQRFFEQNLWIFGSDYAGPNQIRRISHRSDVDICLRNIDGFLDVFELKRPDLKPLRLSSRGDYALTSELSDALAQAIRYLDELDKFASNLYMESNGEVTFVRPNVRIVIGYRLTERERSALRKLNASLQRIEVLTFDYYLERAERLLAQFRPPSASEKED